MFRGERFTVDISDDEGHNIPEESSAGPLPGFNFVNDIKERDVAAAAPPPAPTLRKPTATGFPEHKKRTRPSAFRRQRGAVDNSHGTTAERSQGVSSAPNQSAVKPSLQDEKQQIDIENQRRLAAMSDSQISNEREELLSSLPPSLLERFLRRAKIDDTPEDDVKARTRPESVQAPVEESKSAAQTTKGSSKPTESKKSVSFAGVPEREEIKETSTTQGNQAMDIDDLPPNLPESEIHLPSEFPLPPIHFPTPPSNMTAPNLDPNSPTFLEDLQKHYFPDMPVDPSSLSWLLPSTSPYFDAATDGNSAYHPQSQADSVSPSGIRFSMTGAILAPRTSLSLPTTLGLHHHASDPEAAGYTIPELSILSRSTVPAQRCVAWRILGRILFRLGRGEFGEPKSPLVEGLWTSIEQENAVAGMLTEAGGGENSKDEKSSRDLTPEQKAARLGKHASARAYATEALWLWRRGGGGDRGLAKEGVSPAK